jgi:hypothetical protein
VTKPQNAESHSVVEVEDENPEKCDSKFSILNKFRFLKRASFSKRKDADDINRPFRRSSVESKGFIDIYW